MNDIKPEFEKVVRDNMQAMLSFVRSRLKNKDIAEDIVQEIFIRAFKAYGSYCEDGRLKNWLFRIAQNTLYNYFSSKSNTPLLSLDYNRDGDDADESLYHCLAADNSPEEEYIRKELISDVMAVVNKLNSVQKQVFTCRFIKEYSVSETAFLVGIPEGSVKSATHYTLKKIRSELGITQQSNRRKDMENINCSEAYKYLFMFAKNALPEDKKALVKKHLETCKECADMVSALQKLIPQMTYAKEDETTHFLIHFPKAKISYCGCSSQFKDFERINDYLSKNNGKVPKELEWMGGGFSSCYELLTMLDNEGNEFGYEVHAEGNDHFRIKTTHIKKIYPLTWVYYVYLHKADNPNTIKQSLEAPNLYYGSMQNSFGNPVKSALYQAVPAEAENIRIKRGNGVIDCGTYKFAYVDRYVTEEERIRLDYSFLLNK